MRLVLLALFITFSTLSFGFIGPERQKQLDSLVTNIPREILRNLDSLHPHLHASGRNDEERVFMYYGLFGIHFRYDDERAGQSKVSEYTPAYTCYKRSGVCRDFSALFYELCRRSQIPCIEAQGKVRVPLKMLWKDLFLFRWRKPNHIWNLVKYNGDWHLMDVTWSYVQGTEKYYEIDDKGRKRYLGKVKRPWRDFYDTDPEDFYRKRSTVHPAFYLRDTTYTYKTVRRTLMDKKIDTATYFGSWVLDSLANNPWFSLTEAFLEDCHTYSGHIHQSYLNTYLGLFPYLKRTPPKKLTLADCQAFMEEVDELERYLLEKDGSGLVLTSIIKANVQEKMEELEKRQRRMAQH